MENPVYYVQYAYAGRIRVDRPRGEGEGRRGADRRLGATLVARPPLRDRAGDRRLIELP